MISPHPKVIRFVLLIIVPFLLALVGGAICFKAAAPQAPKMPM